MTRFKLLLMWLVLAPAAIGAGVPDDASRAIRARMESAGTGSAAVGSGTQRLGAFARRFYARNGYEPVWNRPSQVAELLDGVFDSDLHGLDPRVFRPDRVAAYQRIPADKIPDIAERDLVLTETAGDLLSALWFGRVDPAALEQSWHIDRDFIPGDPVDLLRSALEQDRLAGLIESAGLQHPYYRTLQSALRHHREIRSAGGWGSVPEGPLLKSGMVDERVVALRRRLLRSGELSTTRATDPVRYDAHLAVAVKTFQRRHGLQPDGIVGPDTIAQLNVPVTDRIDQIRANLERARWVLRDLDGDHLLVNIAGFYLRLVRQGRAVWETPVIVGETYHRTPVFGADLSYLVLNPEWTVPRSIAVEELLPRIRAAPADFIAGRYDLLSAAGIPVDPAAIDWMRVDESNFEWTLVRRPAADNPLGRIKFMFPNAHAVYLHDTPNRELFDRARRTFSHGCIRVKDPVTLADLLLRGQRGWDRRRIEEEIRSGDTVSVDLDESLPVLLLYWTVDPDPSGGIRFYPDIYQRDEVLIAALDRGI